MPQPPTEPSIAFRYAILDERAYVDPDEAAVLSVAIEEDSVEGFLRFRDAVFPECPIVDMADWSIVSYGRPVCD